MGLLPAAWFKFKIISCDRLLIVSMVFIPLFLAVVAGNAVNREESGIISIAVVDEDMSDFSGLLVSRLSGKEGLKVVVADRSQAADMLNSFEVEQVYIIKKGFGESIAGGSGKGLISRISSPLSYAGEFTREIVASEAMRLLMANMAANDIVRKYEEFGIKKGNEIRNEVLKCVESLWVSGPLLPVDYKEISPLLAAEPEYAATPDLPETTARMHGPYFQEADMRDEVSTPVPADKDNETSAIAPADTPTATSALAPGKARNEVSALSAASAGMIVAFIMFYMLLGSGWLAEEKANGTIKRLAAANGAVALAFAGNVTALAGAGMLQLLMFFTAMRVFFGAAPPGGALSSLVLVSYLFASVSVGMFLSSVLKSRAQLQAGAPAFAMITGFTGGCFWNSAPLAENMRRLSLLTPQGWALRGINSLLVQKADNGGAAASIAVLSAISLILLPASYIIINNHVRRGQNS